MRERNSGVSSVFKLCPSHCSCLGSSVIECQSWNRWVVGLIPTQGTWFFPAFVLLFFSKTHQSFSLWWCTNKNTTLNIKHVSPFLTVDSVKGGSLHAYDRNGLAWVHLILSHFGGSRTKKGGGGGELEGRGGNPPSPLFCPRTAKTSLRFWDEIRVRLNHLRLGWTKTALFLDLCYQLRTVPCSS